MKSVRLFLIAFGALTLTFACERSPTGVPQAPALNPPLSSPLTPWAQVSGQVPCSVLPPTSVTEVIGPAGGIITIGPHTLVVPVGALAKSVSIKAVLPSDGSGYNEVRFYPDGLRFRTPVYVTIPYGNCDLSMFPSLDLANLKIAYMKNGHVVEYVPTVLDPTAQTLTGALTHFSNYAIAW